MSNVQLTRRNIKLNQAILLYSILFLIGCPALMEFFSPNRAYSVVPGWHTSILSPWEVQYLKIIFYILYSLILIVIVKLLKVNLNLILFWIGFICISLSYLLFKIMLVMKSESLNSQLFFTTIFLLKLGFLSTIANVSGGIVTKYILKK